MQKFKITPKRIRKIETALTIYKSQLPEWKRRMRAGDEEALKDFYSMNRNPIFDITGIKLFETGLMSEESKKLEREGRSQDHLIQRTKSLSHIFPELAKNPKMTTEQFIKVLRRYCSTVTLTKEEHRKMTTYSRMNPNWVNVIMYDEIGIKIKGLDGWIKKNRIRKISNQIY
jgi:hypothetical protein